VYKDLPHPPSGYLGPPRPPRAVAALDAAKLTTTPARDATYAFRSADGSNYNILFPTFGQAGSPYARSVPSSNYTPDSCLPDPGLVFDTLLRRGHEDFQPHPGGISSMFFAFADLVIHSIFDTDHADWRYNNASSYLDLSPLYGSSETAVASVRRNDGTGRLWDDVYADYRLTFMPPSTCALLVILNRNHNVRVLWYLAMMSTNMRDFLHVSISHPRSSTLMNAANRPTHPLMTLQLAKLRTTRFFTGHDWSIAASSCRLSSVIMSAPS
jgi:linoleate 10R-lipoxygenase